MFFFNGADLEWLFISGKGIRSSLGKPQVCFDLISLGGVIGGGESPTVGTILHFTLPLSVAISFSYLQDSENRLLRVSSGVFNSHCIVPRSVCCMVAQALGVSVSDTPWPNNVGRKVHWPYMWILQHVYSLKKVSLHLFVLTGKQKRINHMYSNSESYVNSLLSKSFQMSSVQNVSKQLTVIQ